MPIMPGTETFPYTTRVLVEVRNERVEMGNDKNEHTMLFWFKDTRNDFTILFQVPRGRSKFQESK